MKKIAISALLIAFMATTTFAITGGDEKKAKKESTSKDAKASKKEDSKSEEGSSEEMKSCGKSGKGSKCCAGKAKKAETTTKEATPAI
jgi:hypothetical protein